MTAPYPRSAPSSSSPSRQQRRQESPELQAAIKYVDALTAARPIASRPVPRSIDASTGVARSNGRPPLVRSNAMLIGPSLATPPASRKRTSDEIVDAPAAKRCRPSGLRCEAATAPKPKAAPSPARRKGRKYQGLWREVVVKEAHKRAGLRGITFDTPESYRLLLDPALGGSNSTTSNIPRGRQLRRTFALADIPMTPPLPNIGRERQIADDEDLPCKRSRSTSWQDELRIKRITPTPRKVASSYPEQNNCADSPDETSRIRNSSSFLETQQDTAIVQAMLYTDPEPVQIPDAFTSGHKGISSLRAERNTPTPRKEAAAYPKHLDNSDDLNAVYVCEAPSPSSSQHTTSTETNVAIIHPEPPQYRRRPQPWNHKESRVIRPHRRPTLSTFIYSDIIDHTRYSPISSDSLEHPRRGQSSYESGAASQR